MINIFEHENYHVTAGHMTTSHMTTSHMTTSHMTAGHWLQGNHVTCRMTMLSRTQNCHHLRGLRFNPPPPNDYVTLIIPYKYIKYDNIVENLRSQNHLNIFVWL